METLKIENDKKHVFTPNKLDSRKLKGVRKSIYDLAKNEIEALIKHFNDDAKEEPHYHYYQFLKKYIHVKEGDCYYYFDPSKVQHLEDNRIYLVKVQSVEFSVDDNSLNIVIYNPNLNDGDNVNFNYESQIYSGCHELLLNESDIIKWINNFARDLEVNELPF